MLRCRESSLGNRFRYVVQATEQLVCLIMEKLRLVVRILRYSACCSRMRRLKADILAAMDTDRMTEKEILELTQRAVALRIIRGADVIL